MKIWTAAVLSGLVVAQPVRAAHWGVAGTAGDGTTVYVDNDSIITQGDQRTFWVKFDLSRVKREANRDQLNRYVLDCKMGNYALTASITHKPDGTVAKSWSQTSYQSLQWDPIAPETLIEGVRKFVCPYGS